MICDKCGAELKIDEEHCPFCGEASVKNDAIPNNPSTQSGNAFDVYKLNQEKLRIHKFTTYFIFAVAESVFCFIPTGIIALVLLETKLKKLLFEDRLEEAKKMKMIIRIILIVGGFLGVLVNTANIVLRIIIALADS